MSTNIPQNPVFKGDDTGAFGNRFLTITVKNPKLFAISKLVFVVNGGCAIKPKEFTDENNFQTETIVLNANFSSDETQRLNSTNTGNLIAYDMQGRQSTCIQALVFYAKNGVISKNGQCRYN